MNALDTERYVTKADVLVALKGRGVDVLNALGIPWRTGKPHINCPYPEHADYNPSWRWDERKARAYCTCIAGSHSVLDVLMIVERIDFEAAKIRAAVLLGRLDLIRDRSKKKVKGGGGDVSAEHHCNRATASGCRIAEYADAKQLPVEFLLSIGLREVIYLGAPAIRIPYFSAESGSEPVIRFRIGLDGADRFRWRRGSKPRLYGLQKLIEARKTGALTVVEGESDVHTLWYSGFPALGLPGVSNWDETRDAPLFEGVTTIYLVVEPDQGGKAALGWLSRSEIRDRVRLIRLNGFKDASALYLDDPEHFAVRWRAARGARRGGALSSHC